MSQRTLPRRTDAVTDAIGLANVSHEFDGSPVLDDVTLSIEPGETLVVIGPSGTGKSTVLRILAQFIRPTDGTVTVDGTDVWSVSERQRLAARRRIGMVFQEANLFDASVRRNVSYGVHIREGWRNRIRGSLERAIGREPATSTATDVLSLVGLSGFEGTSAATLSGGEAQRVAIARALAYDPDFLLLDEPTSELDPRNTAVIEDAIDACRSDGLGVVFATHDMHQAERIADRVAVLLDGKLIEVGPADRVFTDPTDPRAKKFITGELVY